VTIQDLVLLLTGAVVAAPLVLRARFGAPDEALDTGADTDAVATDAEIDAEIDAVIARILAEDSPAPRGH
jgi:hypothetical protein